MKPKKKFSDNIRHGGRVIGGKAVVILLIIFPLLALVLMILQFPNKQLHIGGDEANKKQNQQRDDDASHCAAAGVDTNMDIARNCLHLTTPNLRLSYPTNDDALLHYRTIHEVMAPWLQGSRNHKMHCAARYCGPWVENYWISHFQTLAQEASCLADTFGPFIPLFIPWTDVLVNNHFRYPDEMVSALRSVLRPDVAYITVNQNDRGLSGGHPNLLMEDIPNVVVLSAGGYGHVPIPLMKQPEKRYNSKSVSKRNIVLSYVGSLGHAPQDMRMRMHESLVQASNQNDNRYTFYQGWFWRRVMRNSKVSLAPRGFGRTSYHVMEILQMGLVPVHVYLDEPWVPYKDLFAEIGYTVKYDEVERLLDELENLQRTGELDDEITRREERIVSLRDSHFSRDGMMQHIANFLIGGTTTDLRCQKLPSTVTG